MWLLKNCFYFFYIRRINTNWLFNWLLKNWTLVRFMYICFSLTFAQTAMSNLAVPHSVISNIVFFGKNLFPTSKMCRIERSWESKNFSTLKNLTQRISSGRNMSSLKWKVDVCQWNKLHEWGRTYLLLCLK